LKNQAKKHLVVLTSFLTLLTTASHSYAHPGHEHNDENLISMLTHAIAHPGAYLSITIVALVIGGSYLLRKKKAK